MREIKQKPKITPPPPNKEDLVIDPELIRDINKRYRKMFDAMRTSPVEESMRKMAFSTNAFNNTLSLMKSLQKSLDTDAMHKMLSHMDAIRNLNTFKNLPPPLNTDGFHIPDVLKNLPSPPNMDAFHIPNALENLPPPPNMDGFHIPDALKNLPPNMDAFRQELIKDGVFRPDVSKQNSIPYQFPKIDLEKLNIDNSYREVIEQRIEEINKAIEANILLPAIIHCGSILEILLYDTAHKHSKAFKKAAESLKNANKVNKVNKIKSIQDWTLHELIDTSHKVGAIQFEAKELSHSFIRSMRNYVHIQRQVSEGHKLTNRTVKFSLEAMQAVIEDLTKFKNEKSN